MPVDISVRKGKRTLFIVYVLALYILFQLSWWGYHLIQINDQMLAMKAQLTGQSQELFMKKKIWMVLGEGSVFFTLLALGFWYIKRTITRELQLAHMEKTFLLSVTHELKTPIAAIKLFLETMRSRSLDADQTATVINDALRETKRLQSLSENILLATQLDQRKGLLLNENVNLSAMLRREVQRHLAFTRIQINMNVQDNVMMQGDEQLLQAMCVNLIENAIKYSPPGSAMEIYLDILDERIHFEIRDSGKGIPDSEKMRVFEKFYRIGNEQTRNTKGTGLGLYIAWNIVHLHRGEIVISDNKPSGSIFTITFPHKKI